MSLFGSEIIRLLREQWADPTELAEELFAILQADIPLSHNAPVEITNPGAQAPLTLRPGTGDDVLQINGPQGDDAGAITLVDGVPQLLGPKDATGMRPQQGGGGSIPAKIKSGSGSTYLVDLYENGINLAASGTAQAKQLQIAAGETIPAGTWALVSLVHGQYLMQVPVWLE